MSGRFSTLNRTPPSSFTPFGRYGQDLQNFYKPEDFDDAFEYIAAMEVLQTPVDVPGQIQADFGDLLGRTATSILSYMNSNNMPDPNGFIQNTALDGRPDFSNPAWPSSVQQLFLELGARVEISPQNLDPVFIRSMQQMLAAYSLAVVSSRQTESLQSAASVTSLTSGTSGTARTRWPPGTLMVRGPPNRIRPRIQTRGTPFGGRYAFRRPARPNSRGAELAGVALDTARRRGARDIIRGALLFLLTFYAALYGAAEFQMGPLRPLEMTYPS